MPHPFSFPLWLLVPASQSAAQGLPASSCFPGLPPPPMFFTNLTGSGAVNNRSDGFQTLLVFHKQESRGIVRFSTSSMR